MGDTPFMAASTWPQTLQAAIVYFADPDTAFAEMVKFRWPDGVAKCPTCGSKNVWFTKSRRVWQCKENHLRRQFSVKIGSIMEDSPLGIDKWLVALWLITNAKNGISSYELHRAIGVTQKTAWFMLHRIRLAMQDKSTGGKLSGEVEVDETFIGGKARNMHKSKLRRLSLTMSNPMVGKVAMMGVLERNAEKGQSRVRLQHVESNRRRHVRPVIDQHVEKGSTINSDSLPSYKDLSAEGSAFVPNVIDHANCYAEGNVHTNGMENFWSLLKRTIKGTYVSVEPFHLFRYLDEQAHRFNTRTLTDSARFAITAAAVFGKRLTFNALTGKDLPQTC